MARLPEWGWWARSWPWSPPSPGQHGRLHLDERRQRERGRSQSGPYATSLTLGSARFSLRKGQHQRVKLRLTKHSRADLKQLEGAGLGLVVSRKRGRAKLAYAVGTARTR
jgi:hypothetical protein